ncbi:MAG: hypothetical protein ACRED9_04795 [Caulobacteraceae bacterium]
MKRKPLRDRSKRAALRALKRTATQARQGDVELSKWEGEFLGSVEERVEQFGRAFGDPDKGDRFSALSYLQMRKLKEISTKVKGKKERSPQSLQGGTPEA